jgi:hypothetical protein
MIARSHTRKTTMSAALKQRYGYARSGLTKAKSAARGAYWLGKLRGSSDRGAHGMAQEAAAKVLGTLDGTYEIADYAEAYHREREAGRSMAAAERLAQAIYEAGNAQP